MGRRPAAKKDEKGENERKKKVKEDDKRKKKEDKEQENKEEVDQIITPGNEDQGVKDDKKEQKNEDEKEDDLEVKDDEKEEKEGEKEEAEVNVEEGEKDEKDEKKEDKAEMEVHVEMDTVESLADLENLVGIDKNEGANEGQENRHTRLAEFFGDMEPSKHDGFWESVKNMSEPFFLSFGNESGTDDGMKKQREKNEHVVELVAITFNMFSESALNFAEGIMEFNTHYIDVAEFLRSVLMKTKNEISQKHISNSLERLCAPVYEFKQFYGTMSVYLLNRSLEGQATDGDVSKVYNNKHMLEEIEWDDESSNVLGKRLGLTLLHPAYMKRGDGQAFIAHLHTLHSRFPMEIFEMMYKWIPHVKPHQIRAYSSILYKVWSSAAVPLKVKMEEIIQQWMSLAILTEPEMAAKVRHILHEFHHCRHDVAMAEMLERNYAPILWRHLKVANWKVRANATSLLMTCFPLASNEIGVEGYEREMDRAFAAIRSGLEDESTSVRKIAITGTSRILCTYWEMVPSDQSAAMFCSLLTYGARDAKNPDVRVATCDAVKYIVANNPLAHGALQVMLPRMSPLMHDKTPEVRLSYFKMLETINKFGQMNLLDMVKYDHLLLRVAEEYLTYRSIPLEHKGESPVVRRLADMIIPSLMEHPLDQQISRLIHALEAYPLPLISLLMYAEFPFTKGARLGCALFQCCVKNTTHKMWPIVISVLIKRCRGQTEDIDNFINRNITDEIFSELVAADTDLMGELAFLALGLGTHLCRRTCDTIVSTGEWKTDNTIMTLAAKTNAYPTHVKPFLVNLLTQASTELGRTTMDMAPAHGEDDFHYHTDVVRRVVNNEQMREKVLADLQFKAQVHGLIHNCRTTVEACRPISLDLAIFIGLMAHLVTYYELYETEKNAPRPLLALANALTSSPKKGRLLGYRWITQEMMQLAVWWHRKRPISTYLWLLRDLAEAAWKWCGDEFEWDLTTQDKTQHDETWFFIHKIQTKAKTDITPHEELESLSKLIDKVTDHTPSDESIQTFFSSNLMRIARTDLLSILFETYRLMNNDEKHFVWHERITPIMFNVAKRFPSAIGYLREQGILESPEMKEAILGPEEHNSGPERVMTEEDHLVIERMVARAHEAGTEDQDEKNDAMFVDTNQERESHGVESEKKRPKRQPHGQEAGNADEEMGELDSANIQSSESRKQARKKGGLSSKTQQADNDPEMGELPSANIPPSESRKQAKKREESTSKTQQSHNDEEMEKLSSADIPPSESRKQAKKRGEPPSKTQQNDKGAGELSSADIPPSESRKQAKKRGEAPSKTQQNDNDEDARELSSANIPPSESRKQAKTKRVPSSQTEHDEAVDEIWELVNIQKGNEAHPKAPGAREKREEGHGKDTPSAVHPSSTEHALPHTRDSEAGVMSGFSDHQIHSLETDVSKLPGKTRPRSRSRDLAQERKNNTPMEEFSSKQSKIPLSEKTRTRPTQRASDSDDRLPRSSTYDKESSPAHGETESEGSPLMAKKRKVESSQEVTHTRNGELEKREESVHGAALPQDRGKGKPKGNRRATLPATQIDDTQLESRYANDCDEVVDGDEDEVVDEDKRAMVPPHSTQHGLKAKRGTDAMRDTQHSAPQRDTQDDMEAYLTKRTTQQSSGRPSSPTEAAQRGRGSRISATQLLATQLIDTQSDTRRTVEDDESKKPSREGKPSKGSRIPATQLMATQSDAGNVESTQAARGKRGKEPRCNIPATQLMATQLTDTQSDTGRVEKTQATSTEWKQTKGGRRPLDGRNKSNQSVKSIPSKGRLQQKGHKNDDKSQASKKFKDARRTSTGTVIYEATAHDADNAGGEHIEDGKTLKERRTSTGTIIFDSPDSEDGEEHTNTNADGHNSKKPRVNASGKAKSTRRKTREDTEDSQLAPTECDEERSLALTQCDEERSLASTVKDWNMSKKARTSRSAAAAASALKNKNKSLKHKHQEEGEEPTSALATTVRDDASSALAATVRDTPTSPGTVRVDTVRDGASSVASTVREESPVRQEDNDAAHSSEEPGSPESSLRANSIVAATVADSDMSTDNDDW